MSKFKEDLNKVRAFIFDIDGVLTDGQIYCFEDGQQIRATHAKDGFAIRFALKQGYPVGIITAGQFNEGVKARMEFLGIPSIYAGKHDKMAALDDFCLVHNVDKANIMYMGDDIPDLPVLRAVGIPTCPADAVTEIKEASAYISPLDGGKGCARDIIEQTLRTQNKWVNIPQENGFSF